MTPEQMVLDQLADLGVVLHVERDRLRFRAPVGAVCPAVRARVAAVRPELIAALAEEAAGGLPARIATWPEAWRDAFEERAAIMEFDGDLPREAAEREAERCVRAEHARVRAAEESR